MIMRLRPVSPTAKAPANNFTGDVYVNPIYRGEEPSRMIVSLVRFTPGARTNWHSHAVGQTLHVTDGVGLVATRDGSVIRMRAGDTVYTPPGEEHWHGGTADNMMCHLAMLEGTESGDGTTWLEPVTDEQYAAANQTAVPSPPATDVGCNAAPTRKETGHDHSAGQYAEQGAVGGAEARR
jgi:quercetin dioxygenase-like cupin family protein